jgi:hypothetical protein
MDKEIANLSNAKLIMNMPQFDDIKKWIFPLFINKILKENKFFNIKNY